MKKSLKLVAILISVLIVIIAGGLSTYFLIQNNKTYYIYDLRIVEPVESQNGFVYTNSELNYSPVKNRSVYLRSNSQNMFEIGIYANTSIGTTSVVPTSSNPDVAKIIYLEGKCYVNYIKAGETTISVSIGTVVDSFKLTVYDQVADDFAVYDDKYYGEFASLFPNQIIAYSDSLAYTYDYDVNSSVGEDYSNLINNDLLRVVGQDNSIIEDIKIDSSKKQLIVKCKSNLTTNVDTMFVVQSYTVADDGSIKVLNSQDVNMHVVAHTPEFLQLVISTTPDFKDGSVFVDTEKIERSSLTDDEINNNSSILNKYLDYKKTEQHLASHNETAVYKTFFTDKVSKIYIKPRKVYTNGDIVYLTPDDVDNPYTISENSNLKLSANREYYILTLTKDYFISPHEVFSFNIVLNNENYLEHTFIFEFAEFNEENLKYFYSKSNGIYTYNYWDPRTHFAGEIYDEYGNVIGFIGI